ncbi:MAG: 2-methylaconitate cis-trans isomerase PrpF [Leptothrix sp. (in: b-proteobacteria)]
MPSLRIPAVLMRGGTSKGVFFLADDLPLDPAARDRLLLRVIGSPDRYGQQIDGLGGATSSTSKVVILARSTRPDCDVDYLFGAVAIEQPVIDWSGNCGNLSAAVGPCAISTGLVAAPPDGLATVRIWQANIGKRIVAQVPMRGGEVQEDGAFELDGVAFPGAEIRLEFLDPGADGDADAAGGAMFPTGRMIDQLDVPELGLIEATLINAGLPTIFIDAASLGLTGTELQRDVNPIAALLARAEAIRAHGAVAMGLVASAAEASATRPHTPKLALVAAPAGYTASDGRRVEASRIDLLARIFSMGKLHHAMTGTGAVAIAVAAAIPGTLVQRVIGPASGTAGGGSGTAAGNPADASTRQVRFGHPSGVLAVGAEAQPTDDGAWLVHKVVMSRTARRLMEGWVRLPCA